MDTVGTTELTLGPSPGGNEYATLTLTRVVTVPSGGDTIVFNGPQLSGQAAVNVYNARIIATRVATVTEP